MNELNPYMLSKATAQPASDHDDNSLYVRGTRKGPALYVVVCALMGHLVSPVDRAPNSTEFILMASGCLVGGLIYRYHSQQWPVDPTAKSRIFKYSMIVISLPAAIMFSVTGGGRGQGAGMVAICLFVGISVATGLIISGTRRHGFYVSQPPEGV